MSRLHYLVEGKLADDPSRRGDLDKDNRRLRTSRAELIANGYAVLETKNPIDTVRMLTALTVAKLRAIGHLPAKDAAGLAPRGAKAHHEPVRGVFSL